MRRVTGAKGKVVGCKKITESQWLGRAGLIGLDLGASGSLLLGKAAALASRVEWKMCEVVVGRWFVVHIHYWSGVGSSGACRIAASPVVDILFAGVCTKTKEWVLTYHSCHSIAESCRIWLCELRFPNHPRFVGSPQRLSPTSPPANTKLVVQ